MSSLGIRHSICINLDEYVNIKSKMIQTIPCIYYWWSHQQTNYHNKELLHYDSIDRWGSFQTKMWSRERRIIIYVFRLLDMKCMFEELFVGFWLGMSTHIVEFSGRHQRNTPPYIISLVARMITWMVCQDFSSLLALTQGQQMKYHFIGSA